MTASTPKGRVAELAGKAYRETGDCVYEMGEHANCFDITKHIQEAISQAVNEFADEAVKLFDESTEKTYINMILKLKAAYAKGEKGE